MKESYGEDIASHTGPESCVGGRKVAGEALTGVRMGWVLSRESIIYPGADDFAPLEGNTGGIAIAMMLPDPARSETPRTCGNSMHRSWEIPRLAPADDDAGARAVNLFRVKRR
jgi:hypothetical protein